MIVEFNKLVFKPSKNIASCMEKSSRCEKAIKIKTIERRYCYKKC